MDASSGTGRLAWETIVRGLAPNGQLPSRLHVITDAVTGERVSSFDEIKTADGTGHSIYSGTVRISTTFYDDFQRYVLDDPTAGGQTCDARNQGINTCVESFEDTDNVWGNGTVGNRQSAGVLDIAGHEATHALTDQLVPGGLRYTGESGGLNEATGDQPLPGPMER